jgi:hypothetical protein
MRLKRYCNPVHPDPIVEAKIVDLRDRFRDAFTGWREIEEAA